MNSYLYGTSILSAKIPESLCSKKMRQVVGGSDDTDQAVQALAALEMSRRAQKMTQETEKKDPKWAARGMKNLLVLLGVATVVVAAGVVWHHATS